jgi:nitrile hydratase
MKIPAKVQIRVHDSNADMRYMVLPMRPAGTDGWSEAALARLVTRDCLIGVALPEIPKTRKA